MLYVLRLKILFDHGYPLCAKRRSACVDTQADLSLLGRSYQKDNFLTLHSICPVVSDDTKSQSSAEKMHGTSEKKSSDNEPQHERIDKTGDHRRKKNDSRKMFRIKSEPNSPLCQDALLFITDAEKDFDSAPGDKGSAEQNKNKMKTKKRRTSLHKRASLSVEFKGKILCCLLFLLLLLFSSFLLLHLLLLRLFLPLLFLLLRLLLPLLLLLLLFLMFSFLNFRDNKSILLLLSSSSPSSSFPLLLFTSFRLLRQISSDFVFLTFETRKVSFFFCRFSPFFFFFSSSSSSVYFFTTLETKCFFCFPLSDL